MAKALKFYYEYRDYSDVLHRVEIHEEGFSGAATEIIAGGNPFTIQVNKDVSKEYLGGICPTKIKVRAFSTASFKSSSFLSQNYGDVSIIKKLGSTVEFEGLVTPYESMDLDMPDGTYTTELGGDLGLNYLKSVEYTVSDSWVQLKDVLKECLDQIPTTNRFAVSILDNTLGYKDSSNSARWWNLYVNDNQFKGKDCYSVLKELLRGTLELCFDKSKWLIRNNSELSKGASTIHHYDSNLILQSSPIYDRSSITVERLATGNFLRQFSFKNIVIKKSRSLSKSQFPEGQFNDLSGWTANGTAALIFSIVDGKLYNQGNTVKEVVSDANYYESTNGIAYYPFRSIFEQGQANDVPTIKIKAENGFGIQNLRIQIIAVQGDNNAYYYLTNEKGWYKQVAGISTPIYTVENATEKEITIDVPIPPYDSGAILSRPINELGEYWGFDQLIPSSNVEYNLFIRVYLPERIDTESSGINRDSYIDYIDVSLEKLNDEIFQGFTKDYGVSTFVDRSNQLSIDLPLGHNTHPQGLDTLYFDNAGAEPIIGYRGHGGLKTIPIDEIVANEHLEVLSRRLSVYKGRLNANMSFSDLVTIDGVLYRVHNATKDTRSNFVDVTLYEAEYVNVVPTVNTRFNVAETLQSPTERLTFRDVNFQGGIDTDGKPFVGLSKEPLFDKATMLTGEMFLKTDSDNQVTIDATGVTNDYKLIVPNLTANAEIATAATAWMLGGNTIGAKKTIGSLDNYDVGIVTNGSERITVKNSGNVLIGTTSDNGIDKLQVNGTSLLNGDTTIDKLGSLLKLARSFFTSYTSDGVFDANAKPNLIAPTIGGYDRQIIFGYRDFGLGQYYPRMGFKASTLSEWSLGTANVNGDFSIGQGNDKFENTDAITIKKNTRNVGVNTTTPTEKFHVNGTTRTTALKITNGATVGRVWQCTNADGTGAWVSPLASERYQGEWAANSGTAPDANPTTGDYYRVNTSGTYLSISYVAGDDIYWDGTAWKKRSNYLTLPIATASILGGIKIGATLQIDGSGVVNQKSGIATAGTYKSVTVDTYGRVTAGTNPDVDFNDLINKPTTIGGYGITDFDSLWATEWQGVNLGTTGVLPYVNAIGSLVDSDISQLTNEIKISAGLRSAYDVNIGDNLAIETYNDEIFGFSAINTVMGTYGFGLFAGNRKPILHLQKDSGTVAIGDVGYTESEKLYVGGSIKYTGRIKPNGTAGSNKQVLTSTTSADEWATLNTSYLSDWSTAWDTLYNTKHSGLTADYLPYWNGSAFVNSPINHIDNEVTMYGHQLNILDSQMSPTGVKIKNVGFGGQIEFTGTAGLIIPDNSGTDFLGLGTSSLLWRHINLYAKDSVNLYSPIFEDITYQDGSSEKTLYGLRIAPQDIAIMGVNDGTLDFEFITKGMDSEGAMVRYANAIGGSDGRWYHVNAAGEQKKYLIEGEGSSGGAVGSLQTVTDNGAKSTHRLQYDNGGSVINYALATEIVAAQGINAVLAVDNIVTDANALKLKVGGQGSFNSIYFGKDATASDIGYLSGENLDNVSTKINLFANDRLAISAAGQASMIFNDTLTLTATNALAIGSTNSSLLLSGQRIKLNSVLASKNYADDAAADIAGVEKYELYHTNGVLKIKLI